MAITQWLAISTDAKSGFQKIEMKNAGWGNESFEAVRLYKRSRNEEGRKFDEERTNASGGQL